MLKNVFRIDLKTGYTPAGISLVLIVAGCLLFSTPFAVAQSGDAGAQQRLLDEPFRILMDEQAPAARRAVWDWGGWFRSSYWGLDEDVDRDGDGEIDPYRGLRRQQLRLWTRFNVDQTHLFYFRGKLDYLDWNHGSSRDHNDSDWQGFDLERGWYDFRLSRARWAQGDELDQFDLGVKIGRQYVELGTGLTLSVPLDAVMAKLWLGPWQVTGLGALSIPSTDNIDRSAIPGDLKENRRFWALQVNYNGNPDHEPFVYYLAQDDRDAGTRRADQTYGYDSSYVGLGSRGKFFHRDLQYTCEFAGEFGKSYAYSDEENRQNIHAWAFDSELRYVVPDARHSQISVEYLLASGDSDRDYSPTNTIGGNRIHTTDDSFSAWGFRNTGYALVPRLSNLGMVRLGASTFPANCIEGLERFRIGSNMYLYHKQQSGGAASDALSYHDDGYLGAGADFYADWQITSDLTWVLRYGLFFPGDAFATGQKDRHLIFTGLTIGF